MPKPRPRKRARTPAPAATAPLAEEAVLREIGRRIKGAREAALLSQEAAAARAGIDYKRWQRLEQGSANPTARTLLRVAEAVHTDLFRLLAPRRAR